MKNERKEELKDEMKNRISMALKDPILQQGFEIICKENAILKGRTEGFEKQILGLLYKYESVYKRLPDLKDAMNKAERILKENKELKEELTKKADTNHSLVEQIAELEKDNADLKEEINKIAFARGNLEEENTELRKIAEFQQSSNMNTHLENKKIKEVLAVGSMWNKHLNSQNKALEEERDKYRDMTFEQREQLTKAKELLKSIIDTPTHNQTGGEMYENKEYKELITEAEQFLNEK